MTVEKNDVDIAPLFHWSKRFELEDLQGNPLEVYIRLVGDSELNKSRVYALRKSAELRRSLKDKDSDSRIAFIEEYNSVDKAQIIQMVLTLSLKQITSDAFKETGLPYPKEPKSDATLEEQEEYQRQVDEYPQKRQDKVREYVTEKLTQSKEALDNTPDDQLYSIYERVVINELCDQEMLNAFADSCTYYGCFKDEKFTERYFSSLEEFINLPSIVKTQFISAYKSLELSSEDLKK